MLGPKALAITLILLARVPIPGAEIPAFDRASKRLLVTSGPDVHAFELEAPSRLRGVLDAAIRRVVPTDATAYVSLQENNGPPP